MLRFATVLVLFTMVCLGAWASTSAQADPNSSDTRVSVTTEAEPATEGKSDKKESDKQEKETAESKADDQPQEKAEEKKAEEKADAKKETKKRKTHKVKPKRMKVDVPLDGTFVASKMTEVVFRPEEWSDYEIVEVAGLGAKVRKGETLFKFDDKKLNEAIADLELEQRLNELSIMKSEEELPRLEKTLAMDLTSAERNDKEAKEDFKQYNEIDRPMSVKSAEFMARYYAFSLDYEKDELDQLEKMYEADDLTEETEEIVLKRQRNSVQFAEFSLERALLNRDEMLNVSLPRYDIRIKESLERTAMSLARAKLASQMDLNRARYELEQRKQARAKSLERHAKLLVDRGLMEIKSPADGVVYYGKCANGRWSETAALITKYEPKNNVSSGAILMTIVDPRPLFVTATLEEAKRPEVEVGQKVRIAPPAEGSDRVSGKVKDISPIEVSPGKFEINFELNEDELADWVIAGMSCKLKINTYDKADTITVPKAAVHTDKEDEEIQYVWLVVDPDDAEAKPERRTVKIGRRSGDDVEVIKGLKVGNVVSLDDEDEKPKEDKKE